MALSASFSVWALWAVSWMIAAVWSSRAAARAPSGEHLVHWVLTVSGFVLLFSGLGPRHLNRYAWLHAYSSPSADGPLQWSMFALVVAGCAFAWWARIHLGALWSGTVTRKADHRIVDTGPYRFVRHPIYTGIIAASIGLAAQEGSLRGWLGAALIAVGYWVKGGLEERFLRQELGPDDYDAYRARTPMLVPFLRFPA